MVDERELVRKVLFGETGAFERLVTQYEKLVLHVVDRIIRQPDNVADVCQEVFIKIYRNLRQFGFQAKLSTWIARIAYLTALNYLHKYRTEELRRIPADEETQLEQLSFHEDTPEHQLIQKDTAHYIHGLIAQLPLNYRTVLTLFHLEEFSYFEIQQVTGMPEGTIKNYLFRARALLKKKLLDHKQQHHER